jgi:hypothetical protein
MKTNKGFDLPTQIRRCAQQVPRTPVSTDGYLDLTSSFTTQRSLAQPPAIIAVTIPLRKTATGSRAENSDPHN